MPPMSWPADGFDSSGSVLGFSRFIGPPYTGSREESPPRRTIGPWRSFRVPAHVAPMVEIVLLLCTGLAFLVLVAAVLVEMDEERHDERELGTQARGRKP